MRFGRISTGVLMFALAAVVCAGADKKYDEKADKEAKNREKEVKRGAKEAATYDKLKEFTVNLYENDPDFRDAVDAKFEDLLREHSDYAEQVNLSRKSYALTVHEDRFRQHVALYDNLAVQDYVNRLGQKLVPRDSEKLFAFRLTPNPIPSAQTLSTGTVYISTGLIASLDNEAQLAYVLAHEMAHVYKDHWKLKAMLPLGEQRYNEKQEIKTALFGLAGAGIGAALGGAFGRSGGTAGAGAAAGLAAGVIAGIVMNPTINLNWDRAQEDEADKVAFRACLDANYDVREVPKLYLALQESGIRDMRVTLGFLGNRKRVKERIENAKDLISKAYSADIELKQKQNLLVGDNPEFRNLMAELKRDNGILALYRDMFDMAKNNLADAVAIRSTDPSAHYFYGKVLQLVGRTPEDKKLSDESFVLAAKYDTRGENFGAHLHRALALMDGRETDASRKVIVDELQGYVNEYARFTVNNARSANYFPPDLDTIYGYLTRLGDTTWTPKLPDDAPMFLEANQPKPTENILVPPPNSVVNMPASNPAPGAPPPATPKRPALPIPGVRR